MFMCVCLCVQVACLPISVVRSECHHHAWYGGPRSFLWHVGSHYTLTLASHIPGNPRTCVLLDLDLDLDLLTINTHTGVLSFGYM